MRVLEYDMYDRTRTTALYQTSPLSCVSDGWPSSSVSWWYFTSTPRVRTHWCLTDPRKRLVLGDELRAQLTSKHETSVHHSWPFVVTHCIISLLQQISPLLTSEVHSVRAGRHLATKLNILVQQHFDLASTTITNIPMKVRGLAAV